MYRVLEFLVVREQLPKTADKSEWSLFSGLCAAAKLAQCERRSVVSSLSGFDREGALLVETKNGKGL